MRMMLISFDLLCTAVIFPSFRGLLARCVGDGFEVFAKTVEALLPELPVLLHPIDGRLERFRVELARAALRIARLSDQPGALKHLQMLGDGREAHLLEERLGKVG